MVRIDKIYTRAGDTGMTRLATGEEVGKWHPRVVAYGTVDELNASLGVAAISAQSTLAESIRRIQNDLFDLGADLATPERGRVLEWTPLRIIPEQVERLEREIDQMNASIPALDSFILPGGSLLAAHLHVARTLCRRAEREMAELASMADEPVNAHALAFINRLSDWLFVAARAANNDGAEDIKWVPGATRQASSPSN